ncbi:hypothetical protein NN561_014309 [Cricetulus griseus]
MAVPGEPPQRLREQAREDGGGSIRRSRGELHARPRPRSRSPSSPLPPPSAKMAAAHRAQPFRFLPGWRRAPAPAGVRAAGRVSLRLGVNAVSCHSGWGMCARVAQKPSPGTVFS